MGRIFVISDVHGYYDLFIKLLNEISFNDLDKLYVIGDVCGIVSGGLGSVLAVSLSKVSSVSLTILSVILAAFISAFTVGGKAVFKGVAIKNCNQIIFAFGKLKSLFHVK